MALPSDYTAGTVSVSAGGVAVTGVGTAWLSAGFRDGDEFIAPGWSGIVQSVDSNTSMTLYPTGIRGGALSASLYRLRYQSDGSRIAAQARRLVELLGGSGNLEAFGGLQGAADKLAVFTGAGTLDLASLTAFARTLLDDANGADMLTTMGVTNHGRSILGLNGGAGKYIRSADVNGAQMVDILGTVGQVGGIPTGSIIERGSNANGQYTRHADGLQICYANRSASFGTPYADGGWYRSDAVSWTFPSFFALVPTVMFVPYTPSGSPLSLVAQGIFSISETSVNLVFAAGSQLPVTARAYQAVAIGRWI